MPTPKAAVHEGHNPLPSEDLLGSDWQLSTVPPEPLTGLVQHWRHQQFGCRPVLRIACMAFPAR